MASKEQITAALRGEPYQDAMPFGVGGPAEPSIESGAPGLLAGILNVPKRLIDAAATAPAPGMRREDFTDIPGTSQPGDDLVGASTDMALNLAGTGVPMAEKGAAGIFGGKLSPSADLRALQEAQQMRMNGKYPDQVWNDTGWMKSPSDDLWRFEIPDNKASVNTYGLKFNEPGDFVGAPAHALINHPEAFKAYPDLKGINTYLEASPTAAGEFNPNNFPKGSSLVARAPDKNQLTSVGLHELQHGVQSVENFSRGINPDYIAGQIETGLRKRPELLQGYDYNKVKDQAYDLYHRTAGEVEARNVQKRQNMTPTDRRNMPPWYTQDVPYEKQMVYDPTSGLLKALRE